MTTTPHDKALLPCPFCGKEPSFSSVTDVIDNFDYGFTIWCGECGIDMHDEYRDDVLHRWNTRFPIEAVNGGDAWLPIDRADKSIDRIIEAAGLRIGNSEEYWVRDADGRVYQAVWSDDGRKAYWWDLEGESPVDPVEFMPHPLDRRFSSTPSHEGSTK